jgi:archaeal flagellin FlaB
VITTWKGEEMENKYMERFVGRYCKIVTKEPGEKKATITTGLLEDVDYEDGFIIIDSHQGLGALRISTIIAIKPATRKQCHKRSLEANNHAVVGIETLIVFIAMVLVAAVASTVLIQTMDTLQQRARYISDQTIREVSSGLAIPEVIGYTDDGKTKVEYLALQVRTTPGSRDIDLSLSTLTVLYEEDIFVLTLDDDAILELTTDFDPDSVDYDGVFGFIDHEFATLNGGDGLHKNEFGLLWLNPPNNAKGSGEYGITSGDIALLIVNVDELCGGLEPRASLSGTLQPESGMKASFEVVTPAVFGQRVVDFY